MNHQNKYNICVITGPFQNIAGAAILSKFIDVLDPLFNELFVITGKFPDRANKRVHIISIKSDEKIESTLIRLIKYIFKQLRVTYNLIKISKNIDIIIFHIGTGIDILPILIAKLLKKRTISVVTGVDSEVVKIRRQFGVGTAFPLFIFAILKKVNYIFFDNIIIDINVESENLIHQLGLENHGNKISFGGSLHIDINSFRIKKKLKDRKNIIGYIGRHSPEKGVMNFVKAIPLILKERNDLEFIIGSGGPLFGEIKNELRKSGCYSKVTLTGWVPREKLPDCFSEMKLIVVPSYTETIPNVILEAMACGTLIVAAPAAAIPDLIKDGKNGFLMEDNSPESIAKNVIRALDDPRLDEIVKSAHDLIQREYTYEVVVENYRKLLIKEG